MHRSAVVAAVAAGLMIASCSSKSSPQPPPSAQGIVAQRWQAPATWGGTATTFWDDADPALVQHAYFNNSTIVETQGMAWGFHGPTAPTPQPLGAFPTGTRYGNGPFPAEGVNYQQTSNDARLDADGDMLVCAVVQPDFDPVANSWERPILAKGIGDTTTDLPGGGWVLMQMHTDFCFHYEAFDSSHTTRTNMAFTPTYFADQYSPGPANPPPPGAARDVSPLPSYVVVCAGRDGENLTIASNSFPDTSLTVPLAGPGPHALDAGSTHHATLGGYDAPLGILNSNHVFRGLVYETAVWRVPANAANIQARFAAVQGLIDGARYTRNRDAGFMGGDGKLYETWHHGPRLDAAKGLLFGLQSWNRVNYWMPGDTTFGMGRPPAPMVFAASEDLTLWTKSTNVTVAQDGSAGSPRGAGRPAQLVTLPAGGSISIPLNNPATNPNPGAVPRPAPANPWDSTGAVHGQIWVRVPTTPAAGTVLRVHKTRPNPGNPTADHYDINLDKLQPATWTRVWLNGNRGGLDVGGALSADGSPTITDGGTLSLENPNGGPITFDAWGVDLTQIGGGGDLNPVTVQPPFSQPSPDPGPGMYDWSAANDIAGSFNPSFVQDVLQLPALAGSTATTGFCLSVDARPADALSWNVRMHDTRTPLAWANSSDPAQVTRVLRLFIDGIDGANPGQLCFGSRALASAGDWSTVQAEQIVACGALPESWTAGSAHNLKACVAPSGALSLYADYGSNGTPVATGTLASVPDLAGGSLLVGNGVNGLSSFSSPWHGYVSAASACRSSSDVAACP